ncbi:MAG: hypothetical protein ABI978_05220 [Chloroflexota bacterium]
MDPLLDNPHNAGALAYLAHGRSVADAFFGPPAADVDRHHLGTHPSVVDWLWETLGAGLPVDARWLVFDGPALVHPETGVLLAAAIGTQYALRLQADDLAAAVAAGSELVHSFHTVGTSLDLPATFGPDWAFGRRDEREPGWLRASYGAWS